jgi:hypothetical protein
MKDGNLFALKVYSNICIGRTYDSIYIFLHAIIVVYTDLHWGNNWCILLIDRILVGISIISKLVHYGSATLSKIYCDNHVYCCYIYFIRASHLERSIGYGYTLQASFLYLLPEAFFYLSAPMVPITSTFRHGGHWKFRREYVRANSGMYELKACTQRLCSVMLSHA